MRGNDSDEWPKSNSSSGGFKGILERVANQFTPNHNSQYQPGFIPANSPHLGQQMPQELHHGRTMDVMDVAAQQVFSNRSFSVTHDSFPTSHSSISRASSDLGARLASFSHENFTMPDGTVPSNVENIDGSLFYTKNYSSVFQNAYTNNGISADYCQNPIPSEIVSSQQLTSSYLINPTTVQSSGGSFTQNIMSPIGTWKDSFVRNTSLYEDDENNYGTRFVEEIRQDKATNLTPSGGLINPDPGVPIDKIIEENVQKSNLKPSYSDVLSSKPPTTNKSNPCNLEFKSITKTSTTSGPAYSQKGKKENNLKPFGHGKQRNRNALNSASSINSSGNIPKLTKIGLDTFETVDIQPLNVQSKPIEKKINVDSASKPVKKAEFQNGQSPLQTRRNRERKTHDAETAPFVTKDQLNNQAVLSQKKQTPKRTSYINNVRSSSPRVAPLKRNNSEPFHKPFKSSVQTTLYDDSYMNEVSYNRRNNIDNSANVAESSYCKDGGTSGRNRKGKKTTETKKVLSKKKIHQCPTNIEQLMAGWILLKVWLYYAIGMAIWLYGIVMDVVQISYELSIRFGREWLQKGKIISIDLKVIMTSYLKSAKAYILQTIWNRAGRSDKKRAGGLENNIPLPTTGEAAMKRLLACRGKDPYNILGVTRICLDEDIKKYYKRQAFLVHPDKNKQPGAEESFKILAHAFELIGESERRANYDNRLNAEAQLESEWSEMSSLLTRLKEKLEESANTIRCTNCNKRHKRVKQARPVYGARYCGDCRICHGAREGDIWAESYLFGVRWKYYACMEGAIYDITEWASCQKNNLKQLQANTHSVQYRIVSGKKTANKTSNPESHTEPELEDFFNNYCRDRFSQNGQQTQSENRKKRGKRKK